MKNGFVVTDMMRNKKQYDGATRKFGITTDGLDYIVKFSTSGLTTQLYSEHVGSSFIRNLGIECHETTLGYYKGTMVVILRDFTTPEIQLRSYKHTMQSSEDTRIDNKKYTLSDVIHMLELHTKMTAQAKAKMLKRFWEMLVCDAILGNDDRHWGNWGYLTTSEGYEPAPIYDNGRCLYYDLGIHIQEFCNNEYEFLDARTCRHPSSQFRRKKEKHENYNTLFADSKIRKQAADILSRLNLHTVAAAIISACDNIPSPYSDFYVKLVCIRYLRLIERFSMEEAYKLTCNEVGK